MRTAQEQLDYEMDLLRARRDGREEEFVREEREKLHAKRAANLDAEMDDYFSKKEEKLEQSTNGQKEETAAEGSEEKTESAPGESQRPSSSS